MAIETSIRKTGLAVIFVLVCIAAAHSQPANYTTANGHAHNDYEHNIPFWQAYRQGFGSIEADVLLINDTLFVAHDSAHISRQVLLENAYLQSLVKVLQQNKGSVYADTSRRLVLLIDLKTPASTTLDAVVKAITRYPLLTQNNHIRFVITGNQPEAMHFREYPAYIYFDGNLSNHSHLQYPEKIALFSANFKRFSNWKGEGIIPAKEVAILKGMIDSVHAMHKPIRFWGAPDNSHTWYTFAGMGIDLINTDQVEAFSRFITGSF